MDFWSSNCLFLSFFCSSSSSSTSVPCCLRTYLLILLVRVHCLFRLIFFPLCLPTLLLLLLSPFLLCALIGYHFLFVLFTTFRSNTVKKFEKKRPDFWQWRDERRGSSISMVYGGSKCMFDRSRSSIKHDSQDFRVYPRRHEHSRRCDTPNCNRIDAFDRAEERGQWTH